MGFILNKNSLKIYAVLAMFIGAGCALTPPKKEYTVIRETSREVNKTTQSVIPIYDAAGNLVQRGLLVQPADGKAYVQGMGGVPNQPQALPLQNVQVALQNTQNVQPVAKQQPVPTEQQVYMSPVTGQVLAPVPEGAVSPENQQPQVLQQQGTGYQSLPSQTPVVQNQSPVSAVTQSLPSQETGIVPGQNSYTGQAVPLSVQAQRPAVPPSQGQVQRQLGIPQTPMQADIVQSYAACPYVVVLQHPVERNLVKCLMCDQVCLHQFSQAGYVQVRYLPQSSGAKDVANPAGYPAGRWRENQENPRW